jgi:hypothetical protein
LDPKSEISKPVSRRGLLKLGAVAGLAAGGAALGIPVSAAAASGAGAMAGGARTAKTPVNVPHFAPVVNNAVSNVVGYANLQAQDGILTYAGTSSYCFGSGPGSGNPFVSAPLDVPVGSTLVAVSGFGTSSAGQAWDVFAHNLLTDSLTSIVSGTTPAGANQFVNLSVSYIVPLYVNLVLQALPTSDAANVMHGAGYFYIPPTPGFHAIAPLRVYDSRLTGGPISGGQTRTISVATTTGGAPAVPVAASAILYNLTVTETTGAPGSSWLALFPFGTAFPGNSSINWTSSGQTLANGGAVSLGGDRQVNVRDSGGSTQFILDVTGYFL